MLELLEFKRRVRKLNHPRKYKVNNSLGVYDAYKWIRKNKWFNIGRPLTEHEFYSIIRKINNLLAEELLNSGDITLPQRMGNVELRKFEASIKIDDKGKVHTNLPIDWEKTLELWHEDEEAYKNKTLVKMEEQEIFKIYYNKSIANYNNRAFYEFIFNKDLKTRLKQKIKRGVIDAPLLKRKERLEW
jgi:hypothetical protein